MKASLVTTKQAQELKALGFREKVSKCMSVNTGSIYPCIPKDHNNFDRWMSIPTIDEAIDWLRRKYNVHIYTLIAPFVDPTNEEHPVLYRYAIKFCNKRDGWNGRVCIGETNLSKNVYSLKRQAVWQAIRWIKANKKPKVSLGKVRRK